MDADVINKQVAVINAQKELAKQNYEFQVLQLDKRILALQEGLVDVSIN